MFPCDRLKFICGSYKSAYAAPQYNLQNKHELCAFVFVAGPLPARPFAFNRHKTPPWPYANQV